LFCIITVICRQHEQRKPGRAVAARNRRINAHRRPAGICVRQPGSRRSGYIRPASYSQDSKPVSDADAGAGGHV